MSSQDRAKELIKQMDADEDGKVSKQEFVAFGDKMKANAPRRAGIGNAPPPGGGASGPPSPDEMFAKADTDGDGSLSIENLSAMMSEMETHAAARGAQGHGGPKGAGGPPPGGGGGPPPSGQAAGAAKDSSSSTSSGSSDPADTDKDGVVSAAEKLIYELSHPTASGAAEA